MASAPEPAAPATAGPAPSSATPAKQAAPQPAGPAATAPPAPVALPAPAPAAPAESATAKKEPQGGAASQTAENGAQSGETNARNNEKAGEQMASLKPDFVPSGLVAALNESAVSFPSASAEVPQSMNDALQKVAKDLKQLPHGHVLEIAGYSDNTGDAAVNRALSQRRADAVRNALIKAGANPDMLVAKGYGSADPIASNDTPDGRLRNRRIEYHVMKAP